MKLLEFEVKSPFRNLKGLKIKFDSNMSTYVIIGTNGAGKSNVLEALSSVFKTLYYDSTRNFEFNFYLKYEMLNHNIWLIYDKDKHSFIFKIDNVKVDDTEVEDILPQYGLLQESSRGFCQFPCQYFGCKEYRSYNTRCR